MVGLMTLTSGCATLPLNRSYQAPPLPPPTPPAQPAIVIPAACLEAPEARPAPTGEPAPAPNAGELVLARWAAATAKDYARALVVWGESLSLKQTTCKTSLEAQTK
jgi:hypothetical protein